MFAVRKYNGRKRNFVHCLDSVADHGIGVMAYLAVRNDVIRAHKVQIVDIRTEHEFGDVDRPGRLQRDIVEFVSHLSLRSSPPLLSMQKSTTIHARSAYFRRLLSTV